MDEHGLKPVSESMPLRVNEPRSIGRAHRQQQQHHHCLSPCSLVTFIDPPYTPLHLDSSPSCLPVLADRLGWRLISDQWPHCTVQPPTRRSTQTDSIEDIAWQLWLDSRSFARSLFTFSHLSWLQLILKPLLDFWMFMPIVLVRFNVSHCDLQSLASEAFAPD